MRVAIVLAGLLVVGCSPRPSPGDPAESRPRVGTAEATIEGVPYTAKLDGTLHLPATPVNLTIQAGPTDLARPAVTQFGVVVTPEGAAAPAARATVPALWVGGRGRWEAEIRNAFPDPASARFGRSFPPGPYTVDVELFEGDRSAGRVGPLEVYLNFQRRNG